MNLPAERAAFKEAKRRCNWNAKDCVHPEWEKHAKNAIKFCFKTFEDFIAEIGVCKTPDFVVLQRWPNPLGDYCAGNVRWKPAPTQRMKPTVQPTQEPAKEIINTTPALPPLTPAFW
jgi:hypothetical protein